MEYLLENGIGRGMGIYFKFDGCLGGGYSKIFSCLRRLEAGIVASGYKASEAIRPLNLEFLTQRAMDSWSLNIFKAVMDRFLDTWESWCLEMVQRSGIV